MRPGFAAAALAVMIIGSLAGCKEHVTMQNVPAPSAADWQELDKLRVVFGHQSVGYNLMAGVEALRKEQRQPLAIAETRQPLTRPGIHHFTVGHNGDPRGKLADFDALMRGGVAASTDIALVKFCFVDFTPDTPAAALATAYIAELDRLSQEFPKVRFVPVTAPLATLQTGPKAWVKRILGRPTGEFAENAQRQIFNRALREHYRDQHVLFDLAAFESDSGRVNGSFDAKTVEALDPQLASDSGHLNVRGERLIGGALVHHLATLGRQP
jgi:hypothetical protein